MTDREDAEAFLGKAERSLAGADSELAAGRSDNCANRAYYACYQAAVAALLRTGVRPRGERGRWEHAFVQTAFADQLVNRRKRYANERHRGLVRNPLSRNVADYATESVSEIEAVRSVRRAREFVGAVRSEGQPAWSTISSRSDCTIPGSTRRSADCGR